jgi:hypothetical protein
MGGDGDSLIDENGVLQQATYLTTKLEYHSHHFGTSSNPNKGFKKEA